MKLFVDDYRAAPEGWTQAWGISEAIRIIDTISLTHIALDHDIISSTETFEAVARHLALAIRSGIQRKDMVVLIHTGNSVGASVMSELLSQAGCSPIRCSPTEVEKA